MKLIPMADFVLDTVQTPNTNEAICFEQTEQRLNKIYRYALFLKRPIELNMFMVCDKEGKPMKEPDGFKYFMQDDEWGAYNGGDVDKCRDYLNARKLILFEGDWQHSRDNHYTYMHWVNDVLTTKTIGLHGFQIISDLCDLTAKSLVLTDNALKSMDFK